jgi:RhtB (resistance to homoserine/threonine) family protein
LFSANLLNLISPGSGFIITVRNSTLFARKVGIATGLGIVTSSIIHKTYTLLGFGLIVSKSEWLFNGIKYAGCAYLIYLGIKCFRPSYRTLPSFKKKKTIPGLSRINAFRMGFLTDILNPQASLCFITIVTATVSPKTPIKVQLLYGFALILTSLLWYMLLALFFSNYRLQSLLQQSQRWIEPLTGVVMIGLGIRLAQLTSP